MEDVIVEVDGSCLSVFDTILCKQKFSYTCRNCGRKVVMMFAGKSYIPKYSRLLCKVCGIKATCLEKYGVENPIQSSEVQEKRKAACLKKHMWED